MATPFELFAAVLTPFIGGVLITIAIEQLLRPRPRMATRHLSALVMHLGIWTILFALGLAIWQRPYFASGLNIAGMCLLVLVSNAKYASLQEPFLLSDFRFFHALLRHPRLYLPFFGVLPAVACGVGLVALCALALAGEPSVAQTAGWIAFTGLSAGIFLFGIGLCWLAAERLAAIPVTLDPRQDVLNFGFLGSIVRYGQAERANDPRVLAQMLSVALPPAALHQGQALKHLIAVQCESFFDARRAFAGINPQVLKNFDALSRASVQSGCLDVSAWGANTVRTEFAFLSGIPPAALGVHRFNPYRKLARHGVPTIASRARQMGYKTICVHPFDATFYDRDAVFPLLGFDEFIDAHAFTDADRQGAYIGDLAVAAKVAALLAAATVPLFIFVITMENHGPLHQESVAPGDEAALYTASPPPGFDDLTIYLRHLQHTDTMLGLLRDALQANPRGGALCAYGDHVPILPRLYAHQGFADGRSDYLIWTDQAAGGESRRVDIPPEALAQAFLDAAGCRLATAIIPVKG